MAEQRPSGPQPSEEAQEARKSAEEARDEAQANFRSQAAEKLAEAVLAFGRLADHSRADTFIAMVQNELTRRKTSE